MNKTIRYGDYVRHSWNTINGTDDPLFKTWSYAVEQVLEGYELWIYGGVLEGWETADIDASLIGPQDAEKINRVLDNIVRISFNLGIFPDVKYAFYGNLFKWSNWVKYKAGPSLKHAYYKPGMWVNEARLRWGTREDGLWVVEKEFPSNKMINKNHNYSDPVRLF